MATFDEAMALEPVEDRWRGEIRADWLQGRTAYGGLITALAARAVWARVGVERTLRTVTASLVGPVGQGTVDIEVQVLREGRSLTHAEARVVQEGRLCAVVLAALAGDRPSRIVLPPPQRPEVPAPEGLAELPYVEGIFPAFTQHFQYRWTGGALPFTGATEPGLTGWCRHRNGAHSGPEAVIALLDAWPGPVLPLLPRPTPASTVIWTAHLLDVPERTPEGWFWFKTDAMSARAGFSTSTGLLHGPDGRLCAWTEQLTAVFDG